MLGGTVVRSELTYLLVRLDKEYTERRPDQRWEVYYAQELFRHFNPGWISDLTRQASDREPRVLPAEPGRAPAGLGDQRADRHPDHKVDDVSRAVLARVRAENVS